MKMFARNTAKRALLITASFVGVAVIVVGLLTWWYRFDQFTNAEIWWKANSREFECGDDLEDFKCEVLAFQKIAEEVLVWRTQAKTFADTIITQRTKQGEPLTSEELELLHDGVIEYLETRKRLLAFAHANRAISEDTHIVAAGASKDGSGVWRDLSAGSLDRVFAVDPTTQKGRLFALRAKLALSSALLLYDNYLLGIQPYQENAFLRRLINGDNAKVTKALHQVTLSFNSHANSELVARAVRFFEELRTWQYSKGHNTLDWTDDYLDHLITSSITYSELKARAGGSPTLATSLVTKDLNWFVTALNDGVNDFRVRSLGRLSGQFGNAVGLVETRKGYLYGKRDVRDHVAKNLKPLDILLEKTPFRLTDAMIPGHWGHAAIWLGTKEDLIKVGLWDHEVIKPHQKAIEAGHNVLEALRSGVEINALEHFLNVDDLLVLRSPRLGADDHKSFLIKAFRQVGKKYDFNFDVETDKEIVCSELIYVVYYKGFRWPTEKMMGRATISPDNVARAAVGNAGLEAVLLYHKGKQVNGPLAPTLTALLDGEAQVLQDYVKLHEKVATHEKSASN
jgi:hypothetical protein